MEVEWHLEFYRKDEELGFSEHHACGVGFEDNGKTKTKWQLLKV